MTLRRLTAAYDQIESTFRRRGALDSPVTSQLPTLSEETYAQGLGVLAKALVLNQLVQSRDTKRREVEAAALEREVAHLGNDPDAAGRLRTLEQALASHREVLRLVASHRRRVGELLHHAGRCEASLTTARLELEGLQSEGYDTGVQSVIDSLATIIRQTKDVQQELRDLGF
jgi:hypothetical protein